MGALLPIETIEECARKCDGLPPCLSFEFNNNEGYCNLNKESMPSAPQHSLDTFCRKFGKNETLIEY